MKLFKTIIFSFVFLFIKNIVEASHLATLNLNNFQYGTLDPARTDHSSMAYKNELGIPVTATMTYLLEGNATSYIRVGEVALSTTGFQIFSTSVTSKIESINLSTTAFRLFESTAQTKIDNFKTWESTGKLQVQGWEMFRATFTAGGGGGTLAAYNNDGEFISDVSTIQAGTNITFTNTGTSITISAAAGGGGGVSFTSHTISLSASGDVIVATSGYNPLGVSWMNLTFSTYHIIRADAWVTYTSTVGSTIFSVLRSTELGNSNISARPIHSSSFTILVNTRVSAEAPPPNMVSILYPNDTIALQVTAIPASGQLPGGTYGVNLWVWKEP